jgi:uncharacterized glyoxalase superfamily protein PhnB
MPRLDVIGVIVSDMDEAIDFYQPLGLRFPDNPDPEGQRLGIAFRCESPGDVDRVYRELVDAGAESRREPWDAFWGQRYAQAKDPDGNVIDLFAPL